MPALVLAGQLKLKYSRKESLLTLIPLPVLWISWLWWWVVRGTGVYGFQNMMHQTLWAGVVGGGYALTRVALHNYPTASRVAGFALVALGPFALSYFLYNIFPL